MQQQLPIFPPRTKLINSSVGFFEKEDFVYYLHNGSPIYCHAQEDKNSYMFITANLVVNGLCKCSEISKALGIKVRNIERYVDSFRKNGPDYFFNRPDKRGQCHKMTRSKIEEVQVLLDNGYSQQAAARHCGLSESAVRYHLRKGTLKKSRK
jgi:hypothetical protein